MIPEQVALGAVGAVGLAGIGIYKLRTLTQPTAVRSLAGRSNIAHLTPRQVTQTAQRLRTLNTRRPEPADTGVVLGRLLPHGPMLRATWEDVAVAIMAPRAGKTTALAIPAVLDAPGPVVATSNKRDLWDATGRRPDTIWTFDPQHITDVKQTWWWNPLGELATVEAARRFASHFISTVEDETKRDIWGPAARQLISAFALAAHHSNRSILDIYDWLCRRPIITEPVTILREHNFPQVAAGVSRILGSPDKTRDSVYITASVAMQCLDDPDITDWVTLQRGARQFNPHAFVHTNDTLHLLSKDGGGSAAPLVAALTDSVLRAGVIAAERNGGRLDPPLVVVLDEAANVCRIADLPKLYSHFGSRNIFPLTILQSYAQGATAWGHTGIKELWGAATVKIVGPGMDDASFAGDLSRLVGEHDVPTVSYGSGRSGTSRNRGMRRDRIMSAADIRALRKGTALLFATGSRPALIELQPWYRDK